MAAIGIGEGKLCALIYVNVTEFNKEKDAIKCSIL